MWQRISNLVHDALPHKTLIIILLLGSVLRLVNLANPPGYIFDEVYHAFTARQLLHNNVEAWEWWTTPPPGVAYEWTHPPVAKYGMMIGMLIFGENSMGWRVGSAVTGIFSILGIYLLVTTITKNKNIGLISAFLISIEGLHISQSRVGMNDAYMLNFYIWSLYLASKSNWKYAAILYGLALASKWSAVYGLIPLALIFLYQHQIKLNPKSILQLIILPIRLFLISLTVYLLSYAPFILAGHSWSQFVELHRQMWYYHTHLIASHDYQSTPLDWVFSARPVWYHVNYLPDTTSNIYAQGNPIILWLGLVALIFQLTSIIQYSYAIFFIAYLIFVVPWIFSPRIMFFYHYLPSATFLCVILAHYVERLSRKNIISILSICALGLILVLPMIYNISLPASFWTNYFTLFPRWK